PDVVKMVTFGTQLGETKLGIEFEFQVRRSIWVQDFNKAHQNDFSHAHHKLPCQEKREVFKRKKKYLKNIVKLRGKRKSCEIEKNGSQNKRFCYSYCSLSYMKRLTLVWICLSFFYDYAN